MVENLSFELAAGQTLGIVGESGSGKSLSSLAIMGLLPDNLKATGAIFFENRDLLKQSPAAMQKLRGNAITMIFQEPMTALNPTMRCGKQVAEVLIRHKNLDKKSANQRVLELFRQVELPRPEQMLSNYPHQISGGQRQRVMIAMAMACKPKLLIADEPTTALDASVQNGILNLLRKLQQEEGLALLFISHDLAVVQKISDRILVMRHGKMVESGSTEQIANQPVAAYTKGLWACRPTPETRSRRLTLIEEYLSGNPNPLTREEQQKVKPGEEPLFEIVEVDKIFGKREQSVRALDKVSLRIYAGESMGLVGESGSGKSTLGRILVGLDEASEGAVFYKGRDLTHLSKGQWRELHREIQIIFQDPFSSLNPRLRIGYALSEVLMYRLGYHRKDAAEKARNLLQKVGLAPAAYDKFPHEFSGGQRQRIGIARAIALHPRFIVCDESVSALDVSVQAQILNLLNDLKDEFGFTYLFISHDLKVVKYFCDRIAVLKDGALVEEGDSEQLYRRPREDYTRSLIGAG